MEQGTHKTGLNAKRAPSVFVCLFAFFVKRKPKKTFPLNEPKETVSPIRPKETDVFPSKEAVSWNEVNLQEVLRERERERETREMIMGAVSLLLFQLSFFILCFAFFSIGDVQNYFFGKGSNLVCRRW